MEQNFQKPTKPNPNKFLAALMLGHHYVDSFGDVRDISRFIAPHKRKSRINKKFASNGNSLVLPIRFTDGSTMNMANPKYLSLIREIVDAIQSDDSLKLRLDESKLAISPGFDDISSIFSMTGRVSTPRLIPVVNRRESDFSGKLRDNMTEHEKRITRLVSRVCLEHYCKRGLSEKDGSTSSFPFFENDKDIKMAIALAAYKHRHHIIDLVYEKKFEELYRKYKIIFLNFAGRRTQNEKPEKERPTAHPISAMSGIPRNLVEGLLDYPVLVDKTTEIDGFHARRDRVVGAPNNALNLITRSLILPYFYGFKAEYAISNTLHGAVHLETLIEYAVSIIWSGSTEKPMDFVNVDPMQFDTYAIPKDFSNIWYDEMERVIGVKETNIVKLQNGSALFMNFSDSEIEKDLKTITIGDPLRPDLNFERFTLLQSGTAETSYKSAPVMWTFCTLACIDESRAASMTDDDIMFWLRGMMKYDADIIRNEKMLLYVFGDAGCAFGSKDRVAKFRDNFVTKDKEGTHLAILDDSANPFLGGYIITMTSNGIKAYPNLKSFVEKLLSPEHSLYDNRASDFSIGANARLDIYSANPLYKRVVDIIDRVFVKYTGVTISGYIRNLRNPYGQTADQIFLDNPDSIYYKIDIDEVSPELINEHFNTYTPEMLGYDEREFEGIEIPVEDRRKIYEADFRRLNNYINKHHVKLFTNSFIRLNQGNANGNITR